MPHALDLEYIILDFSSLSYHDSCGIFFKVSGRLFFLNYIAQIIYSQFKKHRETVCQISTFPGIQRLKL